VAIESGRESTVVAVRVPTPAHEIKLRCKNPIDNRQST
jgi:hypothetical protein